MSMADRDGFIWYDGKLVPWREANTHVLTHSLHYGLAVFEGLRAYNTASGTAILKLKEHTDRMFDSAHIYRMPMPYDKATLMEAQKEVVRVNSWNRATSVRSPFTARRRWASLRAAPRPTSPSPPGTGAPISARRAWSAAFASRPPASPATTSM